MSLLGPDNMSKKHLTICLPDKTSADRSPVENTQKCSEFGWVKNVTDGTEEFRSIGLGLDEQIKHN